MYFACYGGDDAQNGTGGHRVTGLRNGKSRLAVYQEPSPERMMTCTLLFVHCHDALNSEHAVCRLWVEDDCVCVY